MIDSNYYSTFHDREAQAPVPTLVDPSMQSLFEQIRPSLTTEEYRRLQSLGLAQPGDFLFIQKEDLDRIFFDSTDAAALDGEAPPSSNANQRRRWLARRRLEFVLSELRATYGGRSPDSEYAAGYDRPLALDDEAMHNSVAIARRNQHRTFPSEVPAIFHCAAWLYVILTVFNVVLLLARM
jgi:hypothetical protein